MLSPVTRPIPLETPVKTTTAFCLLLILVTLIAMKLPMSLNRLCANFLYLLLVPGHQVFMHRTEVSESAYEFSTLRRSVRPSSSYRTIQPCWNNGGVSGRNCTGHDRSPIL